MPKIVLEINKPLKDNDILIYKDGEFIPLCLNNIIIKLERKIEKLEAELENHKKEVQEKQEAQDALIEKNSHDILVDRGLADE